MSIFRSNDPTTFDDVDGVVINESAPAPNVAGVAANIAILVGQCQRGPVNVLTEVGSIGEFHEIFGKSDSFGVNIALKNKKFGRLRIVRAAAAAAVKATKAFQSSSTDRITFTAKYPGAYGNNIQVKIEAGSSSGKKYTIHDNNADSVLPDEVYDNIVITAITASTFAGSKLITATVNSTAAEPSNTAYTALATGSDGTIADTDYEDAIEICEVEQSGNFLFLDAYNDTRNGYLEQHAALTQDKMVIMAGAENDTPSDAITDVADYRDTDGRIIYCYPWIETNIGGNLTMTSPASWMASILSQTAPNVDPAFAANAGFLTGITNLKQIMSRATYINLKDAGIAAFEYDSDIGFKIKSGVVTQIANSSKVMIFRRRMADYLTNSAGRYLKQFQNGVNSKQNRDIAVGGLRGFVQGQENDGILPKDSEVKGGKAKIIDGEALNTDASIAQGFFKILWRQRIYSSMRYIVLQAEIGESVVVTEQE